MKNTNPSFSAYELKHGLIAELSREQTGDRLVRVYGYAEPSHKAQLYPTHEGSLMLFVTEGVVTVELPNGTTRKLKAGEYLAHNDEILVWGFGKALIIQSGAYAAMSMLGGPVEAQGRLRYIDGCTDSLLIPPVKLGDPCLNHLHFPINIYQTMHTHPTVRIGVVTKGNGECLTPFGNIPLSAGILFLIHPFSGEKRLGLDGDLHDVGAHCFRTFDQEMDVVAYHPDSDYGPADENHPMINRTIVNGVSANQIEAIRTM